MVARPSEDMLYYHFFLLLLIVCVGGVCVGARHSSWRCHRRLVMGVTVPGLPGPLSPPPLLPPPGGGGAVSQRGGQRSGVVAWPRESGCCQASGVVVVNDPSSQGRSVTSRAQDHGDGGGGI